MPNGEFKPQLWIDVLKKIVEEPPSDRMLDTACLNTIRRFVESGESDPVVVWNFYKRMLDAFVHGSAASSFFVKLFDLESMYEAPAGAYAQADRSIERAPWRHDPTLLLSN